jgi:hypothetical protein
MEAMGAMAANLVVGGINAVLAKRAVRGQLWSIQTASRNVIKADHRAVLRHTQTERECSIFLDSDACSG